MGSRFCGARVEDGHVAHLHEGHVQGPRDGGRGERQAVHGGLDLLQPLLVLHPEALLLVHHEQPEVPELHVLLDEPVRADGDVHVAGGDGRDGRLQLLRRAEAREHGDLHGKPGEAVREGLEVLLHEDRGRREQRHLLAAHHRLERGAQRDLRLAVPHVAADQPVHGNGGLHVALHLFDAAKLVLRLLVGEGRLELALPVGVRG